MKRFILTYIFITATVFGYAQFFNKTNWDEYRHQLEYGVGLSNFLGDLGGKDAIGTDDLQDLEKSEFNLGFYIGYKYTLYRKLYLRTDLSFARVSGDDKLTAEPFRQNRNLSFRSNIYEFAALFEFEIPINFRKGHIYDIKGAKPWKDGGSSFFIFAGVGVFHFNPQTYVEGRWVDLKPLRTEGQGLPGGAKEYSRINFSIPLGLSVTKRLGERYSMGIELSYRYTFTDYIDDVSTTYYNPYDIELYNETEDAQLAAYLSNPSLGLANDGKGNNVTAPGQQRGDPTDNDGFMLLTVKGQYHLKEKKRRRTNLNKKKFKRRVKKQKRVIF